MYKRSCDNMSARSSDSDVSDVSAVSRASSASRLSSASYMSVQSERPPGRIRLEKLCTRVHICTHVQRQTQIPDTYSYDQDTVIFNSVSSFPSNDLRLRLSSLNKIMRLFLSVQACHISSRQWSVLFGFISVFVFAWPCMPGSIMHAAACLLSVCRPLLRFASPSGFKGQNHWRIAKGRRDGRGGSRGG